MSAFHPPTSWRDVLAQVADHARAANTAVWIVGGTVRDTLLGRETRDLDLVIDGDVMRWTRALAALLGGSFVELDTDNGVARIVLDGRYVDIAKLRGSIEDDLRRRDFTVDAMAAALDGGDVIDVMGGAADLARRSVRMTSERALDEDPLRLLRGVRIAHDLGFSIDDRTALAIRARASAINHVSPERIRDELSRMLALPHAYPALRTLDELGLLDEVIPELAAGRGVTQPEDWHVYDVFEHNIHTVEAMDLMLEAQRPNAERAWIWDELWSTFDWCAPQLRHYLDQELTEGRTRSSLLKLAALLHDVGKPKTRTVDENGRIRFFGHGDEGAKIAGRVLRRLRFSTREVQFVRVLVEEHLRPVQLAQIGEVPTARALYRFYRALGDATPAVLLLSLADAAASRGALLTSDGWAAQVRYMNSLLVRSQEEEGIVSPPRLLTGHDIKRELGGVEGPLIGRLLEALREAQAAGEVTDTEGALAFVRELAHREQRQGVERS